MSSGDVGRYLAVAAQRPKGPSLSTGSTELEWLSDVMVDGWMQGACVQMEVGNVLEREVMFSVCPLTTGEFVLFVEYLSPDVHRSAMVVLECRER